MLGAPFPGAALDAVDLVRCCIALLCPRTAAPLSPNLSLPLSNLRITNKHAANLLKTSMHKPPPSLPLTCIHGLPHRLISLSLHLLFLGFLFIKQDVVVPVLNIPKADYNLRQDVVFIFDQLKIDPDALIFLDDPLLNLAALQASSRLKLTLVDHNVLAARQASDVIDSPSHSLRFSLTREH